MFLSVLFWYVTVLAVGLLAAPVGLYLFGNLKDHGYPFFRIIGLAIVSYLTWLIVSLKIMPFTLLPILVSILALASCSFLLVYLKKVGLPDDFLKKALVYEGLFLGLFLLFIGYRIYHSSISDIEKFMDFTFLNTLLRTDYFPPQDPWLSGNPINYYYFGHLATAILTKLTGISSGITFNLMVITNYVFYAVGIFSLAFNLTKKYVWAGLAVVIAAFMGNVSYIYQPLVNHTATVWWASATRVIPGTINEFPLYSFLLGDLHAHYLDLPFALLLLAAFYLIFREKDTPLLRIFVAFILSITFLANSWDYLVYVFFLGVLLLYRNGLTKEGLVSAVKSGFPVVLISVAGFLPFYLQFHPGSQGFKLVTAPRTHLNDFLVLFALQAFLIAGFLLWDFSEKVAYRREFTFGFAAILVFGLEVFSKAQLVLPLALLAIVLLALMFDGVKEDDEKRFTYLMIFVSLFLVFFCEFFYLKDIYGIEYQRTNTVFKVYYQLWILLSLVSVVIIQYFAKQKNRYRTFVLSVGGVLLFASVAYLFVGVPASANGFKKVLGLDGTHYLAEKYPADFAAISWLNENVKGTAVIAEKPGQSYTDDSRVSSYTGLVTPLGWLGHEWGWQGSPKGLYERKSEIDNLYRTPNKNRAKAILAKYKIDYIFVGELEKKAYKLNSSAIYGLGKKVYSRNGVEILQVKS